MNKNRDYIKASDLHFVLPHVNIKYKAFIWSKIKYIFIVSFFCKNIECINLKEKNILT